MKTVSKISLIFILIFMFGCEKKDHYLAILETSPVYNITSNSAISGGVITDYGGTPVLACGVAWNTKPMPWVKDFLTNDSLGTDTFSSRIINLEPATTYYVRAYTTNSEGTAYGAQVSFTTLSESAPEVLTVEASSVTCFTARTGGYIQNPANMKIVSRGVCWDTSPAPETTDFVTQEAAEDSIYVSEMTNLLPGTRYYYSAFVTTRDGVVYGEVKTFTTPDLSEPEVTTIFTTVISATRASIGSQVFTDSSITIISKGFCYGESESPTLDGLSVDNGPGEGEFILNVDGLQPGTTYFVRAFATTSNGIFYGNMLNFTTNDTIPQVTTNEIASITDNSAVASGLVLSDGGDPVTSRGFCWSESTGPSVGDSYIESGDGSGTFMGSLTGLNPNSTYFVRAFATNSNGTVYGEELNFTTLDTTQWLLVFSDDFEDYTVGDHPSKWTTRFNGSDAEVSEDVAYEGTKSFMLSSLSSWARVEAFPLDSVPDEIRFEGAAYINQPDKGYFFGFGFKESGNTYRYRNGIGMSNTGDFRILCTDTLDWTPQTWYKLKVELNMTNGTARLWINDQFVAESDDCMAGKNEMDDFVLGGFNFSGTASKAYFDDIKLYFKNPDYYDKCE